MHSAPRKSIPSDASRDLLGYPLMFVVGSFLALGTAVFDHVPDLAVAGFVLALLATILGPAYVRVLGVIAMLATGAYTLIHHI